MAEITQLKHHSKYHQDFVAWGEDTVAKLKDRDLAGLDFEALIEEIESLGLRDNRELESRLRVLLASILKRLDVQSPDDYRGGQTTIAKQRSELELLLKQSPSLKNYFVEVFEDSWRYTLKCIRLKRIRKEYPTVQFPDQWKFSQDLDAILMEDFWAILMKQWRKVECKLVLSVSG
jgi:BMFP domain-containing protein YqiC